DEGLDAPIAETAERFLAETRDYWQEWSRYLSVPFEWQDVVIRSAITLKLCSYEETGGIIAAMTTSLPEHHNSGRTWDYRFCWLRDAYFTVHALNRLGATRTMEDYIRYIANVAALDPDGRLNPLYGIVPGTPLDEKSMPALGGYRGNQPVRVGNGAATQIQNDGYGSVVLAAAQMFFDRRLPRQGDRALFELLESVGEKAVKYAFEPDAGLWEYRGSTSVRTYTVVMCWAACDRLMKIARVLELPERAAYWREHAQSLRRAILEQGWNSQRNSFVESFGGSHVDASLLLLHEVGFVAANDPRFVGTVKAIEEELLRGKLLFRYAIPDDFGVPETAFLTCTFWYVDALHAMGRKEEARAIFEHLLSLRNPAGLLSEDVSLGDKPELWGNIPQTYCMVGLIVSAMRLSKGWEEAFWRG
ncbi:MAG TPA: glycoside hydrolase family 15 protein, partial [Alphaproteobacteria bacterium]|nr:glycoside hydrolase family 15 protein [Alphaproteobacteria bacterium]